MSRKTAQPRLGIEPATCVSRMIDFMITTYMYMYVYVYIYIYMYVCMYVYIIYTYMYVYMYVYVCVYNKLKPHSSAMWQLNK